MDPPRYELRAPLPEDAALLLKLYADSREEELSAWGWPPAQRQGFVEMQHRVREASYRASRPHSEDRLVCVEGVPVGRWMIDRSGASIHLVDVALLPDHRGRGLGTQLLSGLCAEADREGRAITLEVLEHSPAARLYQRLGFEVRARQPPYLAMTRDPLPPGKYEAGR